MRTPLPVANVLLVFTSTLVAMAWVSGSAFFLVHSVIALLLAGQLVGAAVKG